MLLLSGIRRLGQREVAMASVLSLFMAWLLVVAAAQEGNIFVELECKSPNHLHFISHTNVEFGAQLKGIRTAEDLAALKVNHDLCFELKREDGPKTNRCAMWDSIAPPIFYKDREGNPVGTVLEFEIGNTLPGKYTYTLSLAPSVGNPLTCTEQFQVIPFPGWDQYVQVFFDSGKTLADLRAAERDNGGVAVPGSPEYPSMSFNRLPDLLGPETEPRKRDGKIGKSLIVTFAGGKSQTEIDYLVRQFNTPNFQIILFVYDTSDWHQYQWMKDIIFIRIVRTMKWWFVKHFLLPDLVSAYDYLLVVDEDCNTTGLDPDAMLRDARDYGVQIGQPANGDGSYGSHKVVRVKHEMIVDPQTGQSVKETPVGTWTNFVECGPFLFFSSEVWPCIFSILQPDLVCGYGYDLMWANCAPNRTGVLHRHTMVHENRKPGSGTNKNFGTRCAAEGIFAFQRLAAMGMTPFDPAELRDFSESDRVWGGNSAVELSESKLANINGEKQKQQMLKWLKEDIARKQELLKQLQEGN